MDTKVDKDKKRPQISVTFDDDTFARIENFLLRYKKRDMALIVYEMVVTYIDMYEEAENAKQGILEEQGALGKTSAPANEVASRTRRVRKSA